MASTTIQLVDDTQVRLSWQEPVANGSPVSAYRIEILSLAGAYEPLPSDQSNTYCGGSGASTIVTEASCTIPMSAFSLAPLLLT